MKKYSYNVITTGISTKDICEDINNNLEKQEGIHCYHHEGSRIYLMTESNPRHLHDKLERKLKIKLSKYVEIEN